MKSEASIVRQIIRRHGEVINLKEHPEVIIDILRRFGSVFGDDGGLPPGGVPEPPPGPSSFQDLVTNQDLMKQLLKVSRDIAKLRKELAAR